MRLFRLTNVLTSTAVLGCTFFGTQAFGQGCTIDPNPNFVQNDGGCPVAGTNDPNGGCNFVPAAFQATGVLGSTPSSFTIGGTIGAEAAPGTGRDLDWYSFEVTAPCFVNISASLTSPTGAPAAGNLLLFTGVFNPDGTPDCDSPAGFSFAGCPGSYPEFFAQPGKYMVIITTFFSGDPTPGLPCDSPYTITVSSRFSNFPQCGSPASGDCATATPTVGGCQDAGCCDVICSANPLCCDIAWDATCVQQAVLPVAEGGCGVFLYNCPPATGAPANNCATNAAAAAFDVTTAFNNAAATTDGPNNGICAAGNTLKDIWYITQAPSAGNITLVCNSPGQDVVLHVHALGTSSNIVGSELANNFIGCVDVLPLGGETVTLLDVVAGEYYLWRVGQWDNPAGGTAGAGDVTFSFEQVVWSTGTHEPVCPPGGAATNLGLSSGAIAANAPQRWLAAPFVVTDPEGAATKWAVTQLVPEGFQPGGTVNERMNWILWSRSGTTAPNYATNQIASGSVVATALGANGEAFIDVDFEIDPGTYYLTVFASAVGNPCRVNDGQPVLSNYAWFVGAPNGLAFNDGTTWYQWRGTVFPGSGPADEVVIAGTTNACEGGTGTGFAFYSALNGAWVNCTSQQTDQTVYSPAFAILGTPVGAAAPCPADLNNDGVVGPADLSVLLNGWGSSSPDLSGDGSVGAADLSIMLNAWGACP